MYQFNDGFFGPIQDIGDIRADLENPDILNNIRAIYFGTPDELKQVKSVEDRLADIEQKLSELKEIRSSIIHLPTEKEVAQFAAVEEVLKWISA